MFKGDCAISKMYLGDCQVSGAFLGDCPVGGGVVALSMQLLSPTTFRVTFSACVNVTGTTGTEYNLNGGAWSAVSSVLKISDTVYEYTVVGPIALGDTVGWRYAADSGVILDCEEAEDIGDQQLSSDAPAALAIDCGVPPVGIIGSAYSHTIQGSGGWPPVAYSVSVGALPDGLSLDPVTGEISGTPTTSETQAFTVARTDNEGGSVDCATSIEIVAVLQITTDTLPVATQGQAYSETLTAVGGKAPITWSIASGSLPAGLSLDSGTGEISGTPTDTGVSNFTTRVVDAIGQQDTQALSITVNAGVLTVITTTLPNGDPGQAYSETLQAVGGVPPYTWAVTVGTLPDGLSLAPATGVISGTPTTPETANFTVQVTDDVSDTDTQALTIVVNEVLQITTAVLPNGTVGVAYDQTLAATGGTQPYSWDIPVGTLPDGLSLTAATGQISGTPTTEEVAAFTARVTDDNSLTDTQPLSIIVEEAAALPDPIFDRDFEADGSLGPGATWTGRASDAWYRDGAGVVQQVGSDVIRFDYSMGGRRLLLEPSDTNQNRRSEEWGSTGWSSTTMNTTTDTHLAPSGEVSAETVSERDNSGVHYMRATSIPRPAGKAWCAAWLKYNTGQPRWAQISIDASGVDPLVAVDFTTGAITHTSSSVDDSRIEAFPNDWWKISIAVDDSSLVSGTSHYGMSDVAIPSDNGAAYPGDLGTSMYGWGAINTSKYGSYIKTRSATVTRAADAIPSWVQAMPYPAGTMMVECEVPEEIGDIAGSFVRTDQAQAAGPMHTDASANVLASTTGDPDASVSGASIIPSTTCKIVTRWDATDKWVSIYNGSTWVHGAKQARTGAFPTDGSLGLGGIDEALWAKRIRVWDVAISDGDLP